MNSEVAPIQPENDAKSGAWLSVAAAAARLGISVRAVQKRCAAGKVRARRITTPQGVRWELDARSVPLRCELGREPANQTNWQGANHANQTREPSSFDAQNGTNQDANQRTEGHEPAKQTNRQEGELRELLARERDLNGFLRGLIEQRDRDAAELRAALREALKVSARQLTQGGEAKGNPSGATSQRPAEQRDQLTTSPTRSGQQQEAEPDEMDADQLLQLCRRITR